MDEASDPLRDAARDWFETLRDQLCAAFEAIEREQDGPLADQPPGRFTRTAWRRDTGEAGGGSGEDGGEDGGQDGGGGVISVMRGRVFEKVGVNVSTVMGTFSPEFRGQVRGTNESGAFFATGISVVAHPCSPLVPAAHFNTRYLRTAHGWFGGGGDLTPMRPGAGASQQDAARFHAAFRAACDRHDPEYYPRFKAWCDRYFFLPHRAEPRGLGGIFFDHLESGDPAADFAFVRDVGLAFLDAYPAIVRNRMREPWSAEDREHQLHRRGRYVEFNLLHDRGTLFGLKTGGNVDAILMSMPPSVKWA